jgi:hypothetical protein
VDVILILAAWCHHCSFFAVRQWLIKLLRAGRSSGVRQNKA